MVMLSNMTRSPLKISFLMAVHNEEKILRRTLEHLEKIPYENYEVILGLDGCTDKSLEITKEIAKRNKKFRYFELNERNGKPAVINHIIRKSKGNIIIINDADWIFEVNSKEHFKKFISVFNDKIVGGIAESFPIEWQGKKQEQGNMGYKMVAYSSYFWLSFQKENFTYRKAGVLYLKEPTMFLTNIFRRELYNENLSLGDDFERTKDIMKKGYKVVMFDNLNMPRMTAVYTKLSAKDLFRQKKRTAIARRQLREYHVAEISIVNYYLPALKYMLKKSWKTSISAGFITLSWIILTTAATFSSIFKKTGTKEGWKLRMQR